MAKKKALVVRLQAGIKVGDAGDNVKNLQTLLRRFGYLQDPKAPKPFKSLRRFFAPVPKPKKQGTFDDVTKAALKAFQEFHGLPPTGTLDMGTAAELNMPRCGVPDPAGGATSLVHAFSGNPWGKNNLTYRITGFTAKLPDDDARTAIEAAFGLWSEVTPLKFKAVNGSPDIEIFFARGEHGDGVPFDGSSRVLAHAFFPGPGAGAIAGDTHFDDDEDWRMDFPVTQTGIDLITVAAHEFGHALGLEHSSVRGSLMFPSYTGPHRFLSLNDDISRIRAIYGS